MALKPAEAVAEFLATLQQVISCISPGVLRPNAAGYAPAAEAHRITFQHVPPPLRMRPGMLPLALNIVHWYRITESDVPGASWRIATAGYHYGIERAEAGDQRELIVFHWHPHVDQVTTPHMHLEAGAQVGFTPLAAAHIPIGRVPLEAVVRLAHDLGVEEQRPDWENVLAEAEATFHAQRYW